MKSTKEPSLNDSNLRNFVLNTIKGFQQWRYVSLLGIANVVSIIRLFLYVRMISVAEFGLYSTFLILTLVFVMVGSLGFITELQRRLPIARQNSNPEVALILISQVVLVICGTFLVSSLILWFFPIEVFGLTGEMAALGLFGGLTQLLFSVVSSETRARLQLVRFSKEILMKNTITLAGGVALAIFSPQAIYIFILESLILLAYTILLFTRFIPEIRTVGSRNLLQASLHGIRYYEWNPVFSMLLIGFLVFISQNAERYLGKSYLSIEGFAILSFGLIVPQIANMIQSILNSSIFTNQILQFQKHQDQRKIVLYCLKTSASVAMFFLLISVPSFFVTREVILNYYPKYSAVLPSLHWVFFTFVIRSSDFVSNIYTIINKPQVAVIVNVAYIGVAAVSFLAFSQLGIIDLQDTSVYFLINFINALVPPAIVFLISYLYTTKKSTRKTISS